MNNSNNNPVFTLYVRRDNSWMDSLFKKILLKTSNLTPFTTRKFTLEESAALCSANEIDIWHTGDDHLVFQTLKTGTQFTNDRIGYYAVVQTHSSVNTERILSETGFTISKKHRSRIGNYDVWHQQNTLSQAKVPV